MANEKRLNSIAPSKQPWWGSYKSMMGRCYRKSAKNYSVYGGRGIKVCNEWFDPNTFGEWAKASGFQKGFALERTVYVYMYKNHITPDVCKECGARLYLPQPPKGE